MCIAAKSAMRKTAMGKIAIDAKDLGSNTAQNRDK